MATSTKNKDKIRILNTMSLHHDSNGGNLDMHLETHYIATKRKQMLIKYVVKENPVNILIRFKMKIALIKNNGTFTPAYLRFRLRNSTEIKLIHSEFDFKKAKKLYVS
jgi:hypothetical protein